MNTNLSRKDAASMLVALVAVAAAPVGVWLARPRPLSAPSMAALVEAARESRQEQIIAAMSQRYEGASLRFGGPDPSHDHGTRWAEIESSLREAGAGRAEAQRVTQIARLRLGDAWPVLAERGRLRGHAAWIVVGSAPRGIQSNWICTPSPEDVRRARIRRYCTDIRIAAVSVQLPHQPGE